MSYQEHCEDYAIHGNPERDHYDYEMNAEYDRWDGHRADFNDEFGWEDEPGCPVCHDRGGCNTCRAVALYNGAVRVATIAQGWLDYPNNDDIPF